MGVRTWIEGWPAYRQATGTDRLGRGAAVKSGASSRLTARTASADRVVKSICPYCAVGCGQNVYVKRAEGGEAGGEKVIQIEGDPDSPDSRGRLCPKGSASLQLTTGSAREDKVRYRRPYAADWEDLDLDTAMDMIADRVIAVTGMEAPRYFQERSSLGSCRVWEHRRELDDLPDGSTRVTDTLRAEPRLDGGFRVEAVLPG